MGQTAPNPVLSTLKYFRHEYEAHIKEKRCPAGVCEKCCNILLQMLAAAVPYVQKLPCTSYQRYCKTKHVIDQENALNAVFV